MIETDGKILQLPSFNDIPAVYTFISLINKSEKRNTTEFYFSDNQKTSRQYFFFFFIHHLLCHIHHLSDTFFFTLLVRLKVHHIPHTLLISSHLYTGSTEMLGFLFFFMKVINTLKFTILNSLDTFWMKLKLFCWYFIEDLHHWINVETYYNMYILKNRPPLVTLGSYIPCSWKPRICKRLACSPEVRSFWVKLPVSQRLSAVY
jgi:hypothetical protein